MQKKELTKSMKPIIGIQNSPKLKDWMIKDWEKNNFQPHFITNLSDTKYKTKPNKTFGMMLNGSFLSQPTGSQNFPDFLVRDFDDDSAQQDHDRGNCGEDDFATRGRRAAATCCGGVRNDSHVQRRRCSSSSTA